MHPLHRKSRNKKARHLSKRRTRYCKTKKNGHSRRRVRGGDNSNHSTTYVNVPGYGSMSKEEYEKIMGSSNPITGSLDG